MNTISLDAAVAITGISHSTLRRRVSDGTLKKLGQDERRRVLLALDEVLAWVNVPLGAEDMAMLLQADGGKAAAQADMGALFYVAGAREAALYWLQEAAAQNNAEAMYWLAMAHAENGHEVANQQPATSNQQPAILPPSCGWQRRLRWATRLRRRRWICYVAGTKHLDIRPLLQDRPDTYKLMALRMKVSVCAAKTKEQAGY